MSSKSLSIVFLAAIIINGLILTSVIRFATVQASTDVSGIPKPSVPEFTIELIDSSYDVPPTSSVNPYTGQTETQPGYHVESRTIKVSIKNQHFTPFQVEDENGNSWTVDFQYNIRWKGHFEQDWHEIYHPSDGFALAELESEYTVRSFEGEYSFSEGLKLYYQGLIATFPPGAQVDFQVEAMIGYVHREISIAVPGSGWIFTGETSDWSSTQTLTIGESQTPTPSPATTPTPTPTPSQEPQQTEQIEPIVGAAIVVAVIIVGAGLLIYLIKRK